MMSCFLAIWLIGQALAALSVWNFAGRLGRPFLNFAEPTVIVVVAVKGHDFEFDEFLIRLFDQEYRHYWIIFAVESADDSSVFALRAYEATHRARFDIVVAGEATDEGQKIANLRAAVSRVSSYDDVIVFADADYGPTGCGSAAWLP